MCARTIAGYFTRTRLMLPAKIGHAVAERASGHPHSRGRVSDPRSDGGSNQGCGIEVVEAPNADIAVAILESRSDIQVVFTDIHMPGSMDGAKLAHAIRHRWPPVGVVVTSARVPLGTLDLPSGTVFLPKPYTIGHVAKTLHVLTASS
jgi:two-component system, response regulator PdtaR